MTARSAHPPAGGHTPGKCDLCGRSLPHDFEACAYQLQATLRAKPQSAPEQQAKIEALADALEAMLRVYEYTDSDAQARAIDDGNAALHLAGRLP